MTDTGATETPGTTRPSTASTSSTQTDPSTDHDSVLALGERILAELGGQRTNNTLIRWMSHHVARLITEAAEARAADAPDAAARDLAVHSAILQLWAARASWPTGWPPPHAAEMAAVLNGLPNLDAPDAWVSPSLINRLHTLHLHLLTTLIDLSLSSPNQTAEGAGDGTEPPAGDPAPGPVPVIGDIESAWLDRFGEWLTEEEVALLSRVAQHPQRMNALASWWISQHTDVDLLDDPDGPDSAESAESPERDPESGDTGTELADEVAESLHPVLDLLDAYRQTIVGMLEAASSPPRP